MKYFFKLTYYKLMKLNKLLDINVLINKIYKN